MIPDSSMVEHTAVNRGVVGSSPTRGVFYGPMVKRLRHRPFTAVTRVRFPLGSLYADMAQLAEQLICNQQVEGSSPPIGLTMRLHCGIIIIVVCDNSIQMNWMDSRVAKGDRL